MDRKLSVVLGCRWGHGVVEADSSSEHLHGLRPLLDEGRPLKSWSRLLARETPPRLTRWVGNFIHSAGDRLLFFPHADLDEHHEDSGKWLPLDHLTLERSTSGEHRSHWTFKQRPLRRRRKQIAGYRHATMPPGVTPWFSILASDLWGFSDAPAELWIRWSLRRPEPPTELTAVTEALVDFPARPSRETHYYQLDLWLLDEDAKETPMRPIPWAQQTDLMKSAPPNEQKVSAWAARWSLPSWPGLLCAVASSPQGQLRHGSTIIRGRPNFR